MDLFLSKFLPPLVYPLGLALLLILVSLALIRRPGSQRIILVLVFLLLWLGGNRWVSAALVRSLEFRYLTPPELVNDDGSEVADVIVLLAGSTHSAQFPRPFIEVNGAGDRVIYTALLYRQGKANHILLSGGRIDWMESGNSPAADMSVLLEMMGIPQKAIWYEDESRNTAESAQAAWEILSNQNIQRIILVTSAQHMPRSVALFEKQGFNVIPAPTDYNITEAEWQRLTHPDPMTAIMNILPESGNLSATTSTLKEYLGMFISWLRGQV